MGKRLKFDRTVLVLTVIALFCMVGVCCVRRAMVGSVRHEIEVQRSACSEADDHSETEETWPDSLLEGEVIHLNRASAEELQRLPEIGPGRAEAIVTYRQYCGKFSALDELLNVEGIGLGVLECVRPFVSVE